MRKLFLGIGIAFAATVIAVGIGMLLFSQGGSAVTSGASAYVDDAVVAISSHWSKDELSRRASPLLLANTRSGDLEALFDATAAGLGPLVEYQGAKMAAWKATTNFSGTTVQANFVAAAKYEKGDATIRINLLKTEGKWSIAGFFVDSSAMMRNLVRHGS